MTGWGFLEMIFFLSNLLKNFLRLTLYQNHNTYKPLTTGFYVSWVVNSGALLLDEQEINE